MTERMEERGRRLLEYREAKDQAYQAWKAAEAAYKLYERDTYEVMREQNITSITWGDFRLTRVQKMYGQVTDRPAFEAWLAENGLEDEFMTPDFRGQRLNEEVRHRLETGQSLPPGLDVRPNEYVSRTKV